MPSISRSVRFSTTRLAFGALATLCLFAVPLLSASSAAAKSPSVFLNGVNIDGVTGQSFQNVNVEIDAQGNILVSAKGYEVQKVNPNAKPAGPVSSEAPVTRRYFLVTEANVPASVQYDVDVFINSVWVKRISHKDSQNVVEVTKHLRQGRNTVHLSATKTMKDGRTSTSRNHTMKILLGEGNMGGNNVMIDKALIEYERNASETKNFTDEFVITGR